MIDRPRDDQSVDPGAQLNQSQVSAPSSLRHPTTVPSAVMIESWFSRVKASLRASGAKPKRWIGSPSPSSAIMTRPLPSAAAT